MNGHLMASCARNIRVKIFESWISFLQVTIDNVRKVFFGHGVVHSVSLVNSGVLVNGISFRVFPALC